MKLTNILFIALLSMGLGSCSKNNSVDVSGVYAVARNNTAGLVYYKDGIVHPLNVPEQITGGVYIHGDDVYVATMRGYAKNGVLTTLPGAYSVQSVFVKGSDVYATGFNGSEFEPGYWKNGVFTRMPVDADIRRIYRLKIIVSDNDDVYLVCMFSYLQPSRYEQSGYWKNGVFHKLGEGIFADAVVSGDDLHVVGNKPTEIRAAYWKNEVLQPEFTGFNNRTPTYYNSVAVSGNDVYITGGMDCALYWKNGSPVQEINDGITPIGLAIRKDNVFVLAKKTVEGNLPRSSQRGKKDFLQVWQGSSIANWGEATPLGIFMAE